MDKSFRIRTTTDGTDKNIIIKLEQKYDTLEILSLKLSQDNLYRTFSSDYGVLIGRVLANDGLGIPNAKISVFIPISDTDSTNPLITKIYPYTKVTDKDSSGTRYNLLTPKIVSSGLTTGVYGTLPSKQQFLDDDNYLEVYENYYKFTTVSNSSGDYMIFGIPTGQQVIHMDTDLSDIGQYSFTADAMVANGLSKNLFNQSTNNTFTFKGGTGLDQLPQIISQTISVNILPLWGDLTDNSLIGITRLDFKINVPISPVAYLTFSVGHDSRHLSDGIYSNSTSGGDDFHIDPGSGPRRPGYIGRLTIFPIEVNAFKYDSNGNQMELDPTSYQIVSTNDEINSGVYIILLPCDDNKVITDEFGNLVPSNSDRGIGTTGKWRIEILSNNGTGASNYTIQLNDAVEPFIVRRNRIYSVKIQMFDSFSLRDDGFRNIKHSLDELAMFNRGDWLNGFLYFGFEQTGGSSPTWLEFQGSFFNVQSRIIDVTDYISLLADTKTTYFTGNNFIFLNDSQIPGIVNKLQGDDVTFGDMNSSFEPSTASSFNNQYVFFKGIGTPPNAVADCFVSVQNYINR